MTRPSVSKVFYSTDLTGAKRDGEILDSIWTVIAWISLLAFRTFPTRQTALFGFSKPSLTYNKVANYYNIPANGFEPSHIIAPLLFDDFRIRLCFKR
jgi:hypothetical protein